MKRLFIVLVPLLLAGSIGCKKDSSDPTPSNPSGPTPYTPTVANVHGALIAVKMEYTYSIPGLPSVPIGSDIGIAAFYNAPGASAMVDAGTVSVNTVALEKQSNNSYMKMATIGQTPADLGFTGAVDWSVTGAGSVPAITYTHTGAFPGYNGTLPDSITKANGLTLNLSGASNADSIYVMIAAGSQYVMKSYAGNAGNISISASDLSVLPVVSNNTAYLEVIPVKFNVQAFGGKDYVFIKEKAIVKGINIK